jgi:hypothetical protein
LLEKLDSKNVTAVCDEPIELTQDQRYAAQRTVAHYATDAADAAELMMILGIHPSQEPDAYAVSLPNSFNLPTGYK